MAWEVLSHEVIDLINKSENKGFSDKEKAAISTMMKGLSEKDLVKVKVYIESKVAESSRTDLLSLTEKIESLNNLPYGFEGIIEWSDSEFFTDMFESEARQIAISEGIKNLLKVNFSSEILWKLWPNQKETIQLLIWNKVVSKIWVMSGSWYMMEKWLEKMKWLVDSTMSITQQWSEITKQEDFDITKLWETFDKIQTIFESDDKDKEEKWNKLLWEVTEYFSYLTKDYFSNLNQVFAIAKENNIEQNPDFLQLLDNPLIMNEVLETWEYKKNGIEINLNNKVISGLEKNTTIVADKKAFMKEIVQNTNDTWNKIDNLKDKVDKVAGLFVKFWFDSNELKQFQEDVKNIPLIWSLLSFVLSFFLWDKVFNAIDNIHDSQKYKVVVEKAQEYFIQDDIELPFEKTVKLEKKDGSNIEKFLKNVEAFEIQQAWEKEIRESIIFEDNFWQLLFSKNIPEHPMYKIIQDAVKTINPNDDTISQEDYFVALSKLKFIIPVVEGSDLDIIEDVTDHKVGIQDIDTQNINNDLIVDTSLLSSSETHDVRSNLIDNIENGNVAQNILIEDNVISDDNLINQENLKQEKMEPIIEVQNSKTLIEQLTNIPSLPLEIYINGAQTSLNIWSDKRSLIIWNKTYNIWVNLEVFWKQKDMFKSAQLENWKIIVDAAWMNYALEASDLAPALEEILLNDSYTKNVLDTFTLVIS